MCTSIVRTDNFLWTYICAHSTPRVKIQIVKKPNRKNGTINPRFFVICSRDRELRFLRQSICPRGRLNFFLSIEGIKNRN